MTENHHGDNLSKWYTAGQAYDDFMRVSTDDGDYLKEVDAMIENILKQVRKTALLGMDEINLDFAVTDSPLFPNIAEKLQERGFVVYNTLRRKYKFIRSYNVYWGKLDCGKVPYDLEDAANMVDEACDLPQSFLDKILGNPRISKCTVEIPKVYLKESPSIGVSSFFISVVEHIARRHGYENPQVRFERAYDVVYGLEITELIS